MEAIVSIIFIIASVVLIDSVTYKSFGELFKRKS
jgi:hypothetical protein